MKKKIGLGEPAMVPCFVSVSRSLTDRFEIDLDQVLNHWAFMPSDILLSAIILLKTVLFVIGL
jgi:hypothetical protein